MSIVSKAQLKADFGDGETITQQKMDDLIDSTFNVSLVTGVFQSVFAGGSGTYDYMSWNQNTSLATSIPVLIIPFDCKLITFTARFVGAGAHGPVGIPIGDSWTIDIGTIPPDVEPIEADWTSKTDGSVGSITIGGGIQVWDNSDDGGYPSKISSGLDLDFKAGDGLAVLALEDGTLTPGSNAEVITSFLFQLT